MQEEIENGCHQLETLLVDSADKTFDKFEIYTLRNILTVEEGLSPWMRLGHYEVRSFCSLTRSAASRPLRACPSMELRGENNKYLELILSTESPTATPAQRPNPGINPPPPAQAPRNSQTQLRPPPPTHVKCRAHQPAPNPRLAFKRPLSLKSILLNLSPLRRSS